MNDVLEEDFLEDVRQFLNVFDGLHSTIATLDYSLCSLETKQSMSKPILRDPCHQETYHRGAKLEFCTFPRVRVPEKEWCIGVTWMNACECIMIFIEWDLISVSAMLIAYTLGGACGACALHFVFRWLLCKRMCPGTESHEGLLQMICRISIG